MSQYPMQNSRSSLRQQPNYSSYQEKGKEFGNASNYSTNVPNYSTNVPNYSTGQLPQKLSNYSIVDENNKSVLSHKVPLAFGSQGIYIKPMQVSNLDLETKLSLYSEIERLTVINYHLKRQNDSLIAENAHVKNINSKLNRIPELEHHIGQLNSECKSFEEQIAGRDKLLEEKDHKIEELRNKMSEFQTLEQSNNDLAYHNKSLIAEIDKLHGVIRIKEGETDAVRADNLKLQSLTTLIDDLKRKIELLTNELVDRNKELDLYKARVEELSHRLGDLASDNEKIDQIIEEKHREIDHWKDQLHQHTREHAQELIQVRDQLENEKRTAVEIERNDLESRVKRERDDFDERIGEVTRRLKDYEKKIQLLTGEIERLNEVLSDKIQLITEKNNEMEELRSMVTTLKLETEETRFNLETSKRNELDNLSRDLRNEFRRERDQLEGEVTKLKIEIGEVSRLNRTVEDKEEEIDVLRHRIREQEDRHQRKTEEVHEIWEGRMKMAIERELKELANRFLVEKGNLENDLSSAVEKNETLEHKLVMLSEELKKITNFNEDANQELMSLREEVSYKDLSHQKQLQELKRAIETERRHELDTTIADIQQDCDRQLERVKEKNRDLEGKLMAMIEENSQLVGTNDDLMRENESMKYRMRSLEQNYQATLADTERKNELHLRLTLEKEKNDLQARFETEAAALDSKIYSLTQSLATLESKNSYLEGERDRLASQLGSKNVELDDIKRKSTDLERTRNQELDNLKKQFEAYKRASIDSNTYQIRFEAERSALQDELQQSKERALQLENKVTRANAESDRLNQAIQEKNRELDSLKKELRTLDDKHDREKAKIEEELDELRKGTYDVKELTIKFGSEKAAYENQLRQLKTVNENGKQELEKLYDLMNQRKREHEGYIRQNEDLRRQVEKLQRQLKDLEDQSSEDHDRYEQLHEKIEELEKERAYYQAQAEKYSNDLSKRNNELHEKIEELDSLKQRYEISIDSMGSDLMHKFKMNQ